MSSLNSLPVLKPKKVESTEQPKSDKEMERLRKIRERIIRNRASANASRQKKKQYLELLEKKNKELTQQKEIVDKENQQLKNENENLKLQIQYLNQTVNKMNAILNEKQQSIESIQLQNNILLSNNIYASPLSEISNNFTSSDINSPESLSNVSYPSPLFNDNSIYPFTSSPIITNLPINTNNNVNNTNDTTNIIDTNVNTIVNNVNALSPQSSVGEPAVLTNENSLQRTLFCQRIMQQLLETMILTTSLTTYLMMTLASTIPISLLRRLNNNNNYKNLYQRKNYIIQHVPISNQNSHLNMKVMNYPMNNYSNYWNNKFYYWKDKIS